MPTFGSNPAAPGASFEYTGLPILCKFTSPGSTGTITSMSAYMSSAEAALVRMAIYADDAGNPGALLAESSDAASLDASDVGAWRVCTVSYAFAASTVYWLAAWSNNVGGNTRNYYTTGTTFQAVYGQGATYPTWNNPETAIADLDRDVSIYATYDAGGGGGGAILTVQRNRGQRPAPFVPGGAR